MNDPASRSFLEAASRLFQQHLGQIGRCARLLTDDECWSRPNEHCNSIANLILHLTGNVRQWILSGLGGEPFDRRRPAEFAARDPEPVAPLVAALEHVVHAAVEIISRLEPADLERKHIIQGYEVTTIVAVFHVAEHFSFHTGQIVHLTKALKDVDLSLYDAHGRKRTSSKGQPW